jgi:transposase-like protein
MVKRMVGQERISASELSQEVGVSQPTLSRWVREARTVPSMSGSEDKPKKGAKSPRQWSSQEKLQVVVEAAQLADADLGEFLRSRGLHAAQLEEWRRLAMDAAQAALGNSGRPKRRKATAELKRIKELEKEIRRKDRALAEVTALLALKKRIREIWGDADDDTAT